MRILFSSINGSSHHLISTYRHEESGDVLGDTVRRRNGKDGAELAAAGGNQEDHEALKRRGRCWGGEDGKRGGSHRALESVRAVHRGGDEVTGRSWMVVVQGKRRTLHKDDLASAVVATDLFDFLISLVVSSSRVAAAFGRGYGDNILFPHDVLMISV